MVLSPLGVAAAVTVTSASAVTVVATADPGTVVAAAVTTSVSTASLVAITTEVIGAAVVAIVTSGGGGATVTVDGVHAGHEGAAAVTVSRSVEAGTLSVMVEVIVTPTPWSVSVVSRLP